MAVPHSAIQVKGITWTNTLDFPTKYALLFLLLIAATSTSHAIEKLPKKMSECYSGSQIEINACAKAEFDFYAKIMNRLYKTQMDYLQHDPDNKKFKAETGFKTDYADLLKKSQLQWLRFRDADCLYEAGPDGENAGSIWPFHYYQCMADRTKVRAQKLESYVKCRMNGCNL